MNAGILAKRRAEAIQGIADSVRAMGGELVHPMRAPEAAVQELLWLEAVATALAAIAPPVVETPKGKSKEKA